MGRPSKPIHLVKGAITKTIKEQRAKEESRLVTGISFYESEDVASDPIAHKEFMRLKEIFKIINKDEGLHENIINRYCLLHGECYKLKTMKEKKEIQLKKLEEMKDSGEIDFITHIDKETYVVNQILGIEKKIMEKRKMMFDIEKENLMTIASALRSISKKAEESEETDPMMSFLTKRNVNS